MKLNIDYNGLNSLVEQCLNEEHFSYCYSFMKDLDLHLRFNCFWPDSVLFERLEDVFEAFDEIHDLVKDKQYDIPTVNASINDFYYYYKNLANNAKSYDDKKLNRSIEKSLTTNLKEGKYKKANNDYDNLIRIYGVKKAKSIVKSASKKTKRKVKFFVNEAGYHYIKSGNTKKTSAKKISKKKVKSVK